MFLVLLIWFFLSPQTSSGLWYDNCAALLACLLAYVNQPMKICCSCEIVLKTMDICLLIILPALFLYAPYGPNVTFG